MQRQLTAAELEGLRERHYWEYWNWAGPAAGQGEIISDPVLGPVLASTDPQGRQWFFVGVQTSMVNQTQLPAYESDPQYLEAIQAAFEWELEQARRAAAAAQQAAQAVVQGAADAVEPLVDLATPILIAAAVVGGLILLSRSGN